VSNHQSPKVLIPSKQEVKEPESLNNILCVLSTFQLKTEKIQLLKKFNCWILLFQKTTKTEMFSKLFKSKI